MGWKRAGKEKARWGRGRMLAARRALWPGWRGWSCERRKMKLLAAAALLGLGGGLLMLLFPGTHAEERKKGPKVTVKVSKRGGERGRGRPPGLGFPHASPSPPSPSCIAKGSGAHATPPSDCNSQCPQGGSLLASFALCTCECVHATRVLRSTGRVGNGDPNALNRRQ